MKNKGDSGWWGWHECRENPVCDGGRREGTENKRDPWWWWGVGEKKKRPTIFKGTL